VVKELRHPPYSVLVTPNPSFTNLNHNTLTHRSKHKFVHSTSDKRLVLVYKITCKPSAGNDAELLVSCIETLSKETYSILLDDCKKKLERHHIGREVSGSFALPIGCTDVGLSIETPYGFSCDVGEDITTCLATFEIFRIEFI
jgi:hypothetical protein